MISEAMLMNNRSLNDLSSRTNYPPQILHFDCSSYLKITYPLVGLHQQNWVIVGTVNLILSPVTFSINLLTLIALSKSSEKTIGLITKYIFTSLCITDMLSGLFAQLLYGTLYITVFHYKVYRGLLLATIGCSYYLIATSFLALLAIHVERFLGVFYPFFHRRFKTDSGLIKKMVASAWIFTAILVSGTFFTPHLILYTTVAAVLLPIVFVWSCYVQIKIVRKVRCITLRRSKISTQTDLRAEKKRQFNRAHSRANRLAGLILVVYVVCYTPNLILNTLSYYNEKADTLLAVKVWTETLVFLNSIFNPLLFCLQRKEIRQLIASILFKLVPCFESICEHRHDISAYTVPDIKLGSLKERGTSSYVVSDGSSPREGGIATCIVPGTKVGYLKIQERIAVCSLNIIEI